MTRRTTPVLAALSGLLALLLAAPFLAGLGQFARADWRTADPGALGRAAATSLLSASLATGLVALGGIPLGYVLARARGRGPRALGVLVQLPLALPPLASGVLLLFLLGPYSPAGRLLGSPVDSFAGVVIAEGFVAAPFLIVAARSAFAAVDPVLEDVAATLGHRAGARFRLVALPAAWPGIRAGLLLAWLRAFGEFGATVMVAYHPYTLPVYTYVAFGSAGLPAMLPVLLPTLAAALAVMALIEIRPAPRLRRPAAPLVPPPAFPAVPAPSGAAPERLAFRFRRDLDGFGLDVAWAPAGRRLAILGASGSGKSMTLRLIAGLDRPDTGSLRLGRSELDRLPAEARGIAYVPQSPSLLPHRRLLDQLLFAVGVEPAAARRMLDRLGLAGLEDRFPAELSIGQQQRAALGRALLRPAGDRRLLLLDEPFSALDAPRRRRLQHDLLRLQAETALTTVLVTHDPDEALLLADELLVIAGGRVLQAGPAPEVFLRPAGEAVARLLGADTAARGVADGRTLDVGGGVRLAVAGPPVPQGEIGWAVRPEWVRIGPDAPHGAAIEAVAGPEAVLRLGDARLRALQPPGARLAPGPCRVEIRADAVQVWRRGGTAAGRSGAT